MAEPFLTVYAVLDDTAQQTMRHYHRLLAEGGVTGTQPDMPYHISLGSYPVSCCDMLTARVKNACATTAPFPLHFECLGDFGNRVLFANPDRSESILYLRTLFDNDYPNAFPYFPHCTLLQGTQENVLKAKQLLQNRFLPFDAMATGLEIGEFFPAKHLFGAAFQKTAEQTI